MIALLGIALAAEPAVADATDAAPPTGADRRFFLFPETAVTAPSPADYAGAFDGPPVPHWVVDLPGGRLGSATHTERTRPIVVGDDVFVGSAAGSGVYRLSRHDGTLRSTYRAGDSVESQPVVVGDRVYFADTGGTVWCYRLDGTEVWQQSTSAPILTEPVLHDGLVFVTNVDDVAVAFDADDGELVWQYKRRPDLTREAELALYAAPPAVVLGPVVLLGFSDGAVVAIDRVRGDVVWDKRVGEGRYPDVVAAPVAAGTDIYASGYFTPLLAVDQASRNVRWRLEIGAANAVAVDPSRDPLVLYHPSTDGKLRAIVALTGAERWTWDSGTTGSLTTPLLTPAGLLVGSSEGALYLVDPETGELLWRYDQPELLEGVTSAPFVADRQLVFVTNAGRLHSMVVPRAGLEGEPQWERRRGP